MENRQVERRFQSHRLGRLLIGKINHPKNDIADRAAKISRYLDKGTFDEQFYIRDDGGFERVQHRSFITAVQFNLYEDIIRIHEGRQV